jgi:hypothetical protein
VSAQVVEHQELSWPHLRQQELLEIGFEVHAIHAAEQL